MEREWVEAKIADGEEEMKVRGRGTGARRG